ncbi:spore gernimation protein GerPD [Bacillus halotolerans]|uniref:spore gernimation protein GerPD n=1 Tax=Bacillus halotolerans TaxID=260554 RepID=UPI002DB908B8|nr:spore gernimation protein GerPD [Bacillus halotolerans]MEC1405948.1 spore gernimation protein GerPD [Bacillus halotolerans]
MIFTVVNRSLEIGDIRMNGVSSSSVFQIGDAESIYLSSIFDTPPESLIIGPFAPLPSNHA